MTHPNETPEPLAQEQAGEMPEIAAIRAALDALPPETRGTWRKLDKLPYIHVTEDPKASPWSAPCVGRFDYMDTADYMMACNPEAMTAVLAHYDAALQAKDAEIARLRADAGRYQWLRTLPVECPTDGLDIAMWQDCHGDGIRGDALDFAVDSAMKGEAL